MDISYSYFNISYYQKVIKLWEGMGGLGLRSFDDSREGIARYIARNPDTSFLAFDGGEVVGSILCGNDGRRGFIYHLCVRSDCRKKGIATELVNRALAALKDNGITKVALVAFTSNDTATKFWESKGFTLREDLNYFNLSLCDNNI